MKYLKLYEDFYFTEPIISDDIETSNIDAKMEEIKDLLPQNYTLEYEVEMKSEDGKKQGFLFVHLFMEETNMTLDWNIDLDEPQIRLFARGTEDDANISYETEVSTVDEALDMIEKDIHKVCGISEGLLLEKNVPKNPALWQSCVSWAKSKYDVWPSAYACGAAAKRYKSKGGKWKKKKKS